MKSPFNDPAELAFRFSTVVVMLAAAAGFICAALITIAKQLKSNPDGKEYL